jgi:hypothetical protein
MSNLIVMSMGAELRNLLNDANFNKSLSTLILQKMKDKDFTQFLEV